MDAATNQEVFRRYLEMWNTGNVALADEVLAANYVDHAHPEIIGTESVKRSVLDIRAAFPDFQITIESITSEGDNVIVRGIVSRTFQGNKMNSPVGWTARIVDGKMLELHTHTSR